MTDRCPVCLQRYEFVTDGPFGIGLIKAVHPVGRCEPPKPVVYEPDYDEDAPVSKMGRIKKPIARICDWCDEPFKTHFPSLKVCSTKCGRAKRIAYSAEYYAKGTPRKRRKNRKAREFVGRVREYVRQQKRDAA